MDSLARLRPFRPLGRRSPTSHASPARTISPKSWLLVALFAFPWLYGGRQRSFSTTHTTAAAWASGRVIQELISAWYVHGLYTLWFAPLGLAVLYYLIPKMSGLAIQYGSKTQIAFWTLDHLRALDRRA